MQTPVTSQRYPSLNELKRVINMCRNMSLNVSFKGGLDSSHSIMIYCPVIYNILFKIPDHPSCAGAWRLCLGSNRADYHENFALAALRCLTEFSRNWFLFCNVAAVLGDRQIPSPSFPSVSTKLLSVRQHLWCFHFTISNLLMIRQTVDRSKWSLCHVYYMT